MSGVLNGNLPESSRVLRALNRARQTAMRLEDESVLLQGVCEALVFEGYYAIAWVGLTKHHSEKSIRLAACAGISTRSIRAAQTPLPLAEGPVFATIQAGKPTIIEINPDDPLWCLCGENESAPGVCACFPLPVEDKIAGALTIHPISCQPFPASEMQLLSEFANDLGFRVQMLRAEERRRWLASFPETNSNPVAEVDLAARAILYLNPAGKELFPDLLTSNLSHPWTTGLEEVAAQLRAGGEKSIRREVQVHDRFYDQTMTCPSGGTRLRIYGVDITGRMEAEQELRESREDLNHAQAVARTGSWRLDLARNELRWSDEAYCIFGIAIGKPLTYEGFLEAVYPEDREYVDAQWKAALKGAPYDCEHRVVAGGRIKWVRERAVLEVGADGRLSSGFGTVQDITEKKEAEQALLRAKQEWERTFDAVPDLIAIIDNQHRIVRVNHAMANRLGVSPEACVGKSCSELVHGTPCPPGFCPHTCSLADGRDHVVEVHEARLGGDFLVTTSPLRDERGRSIGSVHVARDVTERNRVLRALREGEHRLKQAMVLGRCFAFEWNPTTDEVIRSGESGPILGLSGQQAVEDTGRNFFSRVHPEDRQTFTHVVQNLRPEADTYRIKYRVNKPEGQNVILEEMGRGSFGLDGKMVKLVGITFDITERERTQTALRETEQRYALAQRAANIASWEWDFRTGEILWSEHVDSLFGLSPGTFGRTLADFLVCVHPEDRPKVEEALHTAAETGRSYHLEHRVLRADGEERWMRGIAEVHRDESGVPARLIGTLGDITSRITAEHARAAYLARVNTLVQASREIMAEISSTGLMLVAAKAAQDLTGGTEILCGQNYRRGKFAVGARIAAGNAPSSPATETVTIPAGDTFLEWLETRDTERSLEAPLPAWWCPERSPELNASFSRASGGGDARVTLPEAPKPGPGFLGARLTARDGTANGFILVAGKPGPGFSGEDEALLAQLAALTSVAQQRFEAKREALRRASELRAVFGAMSELVVIYDVHGTPVQVNPATLRLFGFNPVGHSVAQIIRRMKIRHLDGRRMKVEEMPCQRALTGETIRNARMVVTDATGTDYIVVASATQLAEGQQVLGTVCVWHDVTERERLLNELEDRVEERTATLKQAFERLESEMKERKHAEAALAESEELYRTLFQHAPIGILMSDLSTGKIYGANEAAGVILGWSPEELTRLKTPVLYGRRAERARLLAEVVKHGRLDVPDFQARCRDGKLIDTVLQINRLALHGREVVMVLLQDITQRKQARKREQGVTRLLELFATRHSLSQYLQAVVRFLREWCECRCVGVRLLGEGKLPYAAAIGFSREFLRAEYEFCLGNNSCPCVRMLAGQALPAERELATERGSFVCNQLSHCSKQFTTAQKTSHLLPCLQCGFESVAHVPIRFNEQVLGAIHLADHRVNRLPKEITAFVEGISPIIGEAIHRFQVEAELREREQRLRSMFEHHDAIMLLVEDPSGMIKDANTAAARFYGYSRERLRAMKMAELNATPTTPARAKQERAACERRTNFVSSHRLASGETRIVEVHASPVQVGEHQAHFYIIHDITERKRLEHRILDVGDEERQRIGRDLHDSLGGNLTGVALLTKGLAQSLGEKAVPEAALAREIVAAVNQAILQSRSIARGVCPVGLGKYGLVTGLQEYAINTSTMFGISCRSSTLGDVTVRDEITATHLYRIVQEAVANAIRHGKARNIDIRLDAGRGGLTLSVQDDGVGFSAASPPEGGMGLRSMHYRADVVGASLSITSTPGKGTLVFCRLKGDQTASSAPTKPPDPVSRISPKSQGTAEGK